MEVERAALSCFTSSRRAFTSGSWEVVMFVLAALEAHVEVDGRVMLSGGKSFLVGHFVFWGSGLRLLSVAFLALHEPVPVRCCPPQRMQIGMQEGRSCGSCLSPHRGQRPLLGSGHTSYLWPGRRQFVHASGLPLYGVHLYTTLM